MTCRNGNQTIGAACWRKARKFVTAEALTNKEARGTLEMIGHATRCKLYRRRKGA